MERVLGGWDNFYVILGSSAAALTGLQFVVVTLIGGETEIKTGNPEIRVFATPTVVHFCSVLIISAIYSAPWRDVWHASAALTAYGAIGVLYGIITVLRAFQRMSYKPVLEDWLFHTVFPFICYLALLVGALRLERQPGAMMFLIAASALLLLLIGIRNAWDSVLYIAIDRKRKI